VVCAENWHMSWRPWVIEDAGLRSCRLCHRALRSPVRPTAPARHLFEASTVVVVEGPICALSLATAGTPAIALWARMRPRGS
jgi:hypothetical protein